MTHDAIIGLIVFSAAAAMAVLLIHGRAGRIRPPNWILAALVQSAAAATSTGVAPSAAPADSVTHFDRISIRPLP